VDLLVCGGALPTFLLERIAAATGATTITPQPPQSVRFHPARLSPEFESLKPLMAAEDLQWRFVD